MILRPPINRLTTRSLAASNNHNIFLFSKSPTRAASPRPLRLAINRLGEKGEWNLDELKIEFEDLILADAPIEISGFTLEEIDQIVLSEADDALERGPLAPEPDAVAVARPGDVFALVVVQTF